MCPILRSSIDLLKIFYKHNFQLALLSTLGVYANGITVLVTTEAEMLKFANY